MERMDKGKNRKSEHEFHMLRKAKLVGAGLILATSLSYGQQLFDANANTTKTEDARALKETRNAPLKMLNWAGFLGSSSSKKPKEITQIFASITVPRVYDLSRETYALAFIGLRGAVRDSNEAKPISDSFMLQLCLVVSVNNGSAKYDITYQVLPEDKNAKRLELPMNPSDILYLSMTQMFGSADLWSLRAENATQNKIAILDSIRYTGPKSHAIWIVEAPEVEGKQAALADIPEFEIGNCSVIVDNKPLTLAELQHRSIDMVDKRDGSAVLSTMQLERKNNTSSFVIKYSKREQRNLSELIREK